MTYRSDAQRKFFEGLEEEDPERPEQSTEEEVVPEPTDTENEFIGELFNARTNED